MFYKTLIILFISSSTFAYEIKNIKLIDFKSDKEIAIDFSNEKKIVVLNFWASWCTSCVGEIPLLHKLKEKYEKKGVLFYGVNAGDSKMKIKKFIRRYKFNYDVLKDANKKYSKSIGVESLPVTLVIKDGKIVFEGFRPPEGLEKYL